jgi:5-methyltetrahydrofolate--homocysteine methyltransferase
MMGLSVYNAMKTAVDAGADIIGSNCGNGIDGMIDIVRIIRENHDKPDPCTANAGLPIYRDGETIFRERPEQMAQKAPELVKAGQTL